MARFYSNENIALWIVAELKRLAHDVLTALDAVRANASVRDVDVLAFAVAERHILLSPNRRHFLQPHRNSTVGHNGMLLCTFDSDFIRQPRRRPVRNKSE